jgi:hypothetical protein
MIAPLRPEVAERVTAALPDVGVLVLAPLD